MPRMRLFLTLLLVAAAAMVIGFAISTLLPPGRRVGPPPQRDLVQPARPPALVATQDGTAVARTVTMVRTQPA